MARLSILGIGNMGQAIAGVAGRGGHTVQLLGSGDVDTALTGDIVVLAVPYPALTAVLAQRQDQRRPQPTALLAQESSFRSAWPPRFYTEWLRSARPPAPLIRKRF